MKLGSGQVPSPALPPRLSSRTSSGRTASRSRTARPSLPKPGPPPTGYAFRITRLSCSRLKGIDVGGTDFRGNEDSGQAGKLVQGRPGKVVKGVVVGEVLGLEEQSPAYQAPQVNTGRRIGLGRMELPVEELGGDELVGMDIGQDVQVPRVPGWKGQVLACYPSPKDTDFLSLLRAAFIYRLS